MRKIQLVFVVCVALLRFRRTEDVLQIAGLPGNVIHKRQGCFACEYDEY